MDFKDRWRVIEECGGGGQGKVYRVFDDSKFKFEQYLFPKIENSIRELTPIQKNDKFRKQFINYFRRTVFELIRMGDPINHCALKVLHEPEDARDAKKAEARIKKEIKAMSETSHPNLLKILDHDPDAKWFVSEFHPKGTLSDNKDWFTGDFTGALRAFRPLVEGVSELHKRGSVHRDIKPQNVFLASNDNLILGDFGLVFFSDEQHTRVSQIFENVGSRDWMPPWAVRKRIEDVKPTFDVFSLGKLLWAMVSNEPFLPFWYFDRAEYNLEQIFPNAQSIKLANPLFKKCIVENEGDCLPDATTLLKEVDKVISMIDMNADLISDDSVRICKICGIGNYALIINREPMDTKNFGIDPKGMQSFKIFICSHCGHAQLFSFVENQDPPAWSK